MWKLVLHQRQEVDYNTVRLNEAVGERGPLIVLSSSPTVILDEAPPQAREGMCFVEKSSVKAS